MNPIDVPNRPLFFAKEKLLDLTSFNIVFSIIAKDVNCPTNVVEEAFADNLFAVFRTLSELFSATLHLLASGLAERAAANTTSIVPSILVHVVPSIFLSLASDVSH